MNIVICNSQSWFELRDDISLEHNILSIKDKSELCANKLRNFKPDFIFFHIGIGSSRKRYLAISIV